MVEVRNNYFFRYQIFLIFRYKGQDYWYNKVIPVKRDVSTHFYTLIVQPDNTYEVLIDNEKVRSANLVDDFDFHTNPEYSPDSSLYMREEFCALGFEIFQDNYGTIFDNILITDDVEYAKNAASNVKTTQSGKFFFITVNVKRRKEGKRKTV